MTLWTIQPLSALEDLKTCGTFRCNEEKSFNLSKPDSLKKPYQWLIAQMRQKIGAPPQGVTYPIWAWHTWNFERVCPDPDSAAFLRRTEEKVLLTLDIPDDAVVLTDFDAWQSVMMNAFVPKDASEEEFAALEAQLDALDGDALQQAIEASWPNVFLTDRVDSEFFTRGKYIQATFWEIRAEYVTATRVLPVSDSN